MSRVALVLVAAVAAAAAGCVGTPGIAGGPGAPPAPNGYWMPPASVRAAPAAAPTPPPAIADSLLRRLTLADAVDVALQNNPATRISWAQARASADLYGASRGSLYPSLSLNGTLTRSRSIAVPGRLAGERTQYGPSLNLSYLVFDFGGRGGAIESARQVAIAANLAHNATVQNTVLQVEASVFSYLATRALRDAQRTALNEATANLAAANDRHDVGLATIADVLQARTARSQVQLDLETLDGQLNVARGALAVAMGLPANTTLDLPDEPAPDSARINAIGASVDSLIDVATLN
ncbi:MAG: TolC family protein, partial [Gemmatimonadota bacterium]|nr:TolC family protein [Gemmatimonadota bacterium]